MGSLGWYPDGEWDQAGETSPPGVEGGCSQTWGPVEVASAGTMEPWVRAGAALAPDEPFLPPLYPIQISNPPTAACVCWQGRVGSAAAVPLRSLCGWTCHPPVSPPWQSHLWGWGCVWWGPSPCSAATEQLLGPPGPRRI